jgi:transcriptional regulator with XRE-family HTH domain
MPDDGGVTADGTTNALGDFLRASRARVTPEEAGIEVFGDRRRVSGLRREELAMLAGLSSSYYTRLEQGHSRGASAQVLDALAAALGLDETERAHLRQLGRSAPARSRPRRRAPEHPDAALVELLSSMAGIPALVLGAHNDVLAWNPLGHALLAGHLDFDAPRDAATRPNMTRMVFLDPDTRVLYADWPAKARAVVGSLRLAATRDPDDLGFSELVGSLCVGSSVFAGLWADQRVQACATAAYRLRHPMVGELTVTQQTLRSAQTPAQSLVTHTTTPGSASADALELLGRLVSDGRPGALPDRVSTAHPGRSYTI